MHHEYAGAISYKSDLADVISDYKRLSPRQVFEDDGEALVTIVCDSLRPEEFAESHQLADWHALKKKVGDRFTGWLAGGSDWKTLASLIVIENRVLYSRDADFARVIDCSIEGLPTEIALFVKTLATENKK